MRLTTAACVAGVLMCGSIAIWWPGNVAPPLVVTPAQAQQLSAAVRQGLNIVVAGGTGAGKTTLLNALLAEEAFAQARVVLLEDTAELQCRSPNRVELLTRTRAPIVDMRMLVRMTVVLGLLHRLRLQPLRHVGDLAVEAEEAA